MSEEGEKDVEAAIEDRCKEGEEGVEAVMEELIEAAGQDKSISSPKSDCSDDMFEDAFEDAVENVTESQPISDNDEFVTDQAMDAGKDFNDNDKDYEPEKEAMDVEGDPGEEVENGDDVESVKDVEEGDNHDDKDDEMGDKDAEKDDKESAPEDAIIDDEIDSGKDNETDVRDIEEVEEGVEEVEDDKQIDEGDSDNDKGLPEADKEDEEGDGEVEGDKEVDGGDKDVDESGKDKSLPEADKEGEEAHGSDSESGVKATENDEVLTEASIDSHFMLPACEVIISEGVRKKPEVITLEDDDEDGEEEEEEGEEEDNDEVDKKDGKKDDKKDDKKDKKATKIPVKTEKKLPATPSTSSSSRPSRPRGQVIAPTSSRSNIPVAVSARNVGVIGVRKRTCFPVDRYIDTMPTSAKKNRRTVETQCDICGLNIQVRNLPKHFAIKHNIKPEVHHGHLHDCDFCYIKNDKSRFDNTDLYILHLNHVHKQAVGKVEIHQLKFNNYQEFEAFREDIQIQCTTQFVNPQVTENTTLYRCNRFAYQEDLAKPDPARNRARRKITSGCPAFIESIFDPETSRVTARFCLDHIGHDLAASFISNKTYNHIERERLIHQINEMNTKFGEKFRKGSIESLRNLKVNLAKAFNKFDEDNPLFKDGKYVPPKEKLAVQGTVPPPGLKTYTGVKSFSKPGPSGSNPGSTHESNPGSAHGSNPGSPVDSNPASPAASPPASPAASPPASPAFTDASEGPASPVPLLSPTIVVPEPKKAKELKPVYPLRPTTVPKNILVAPPPRLGVADTSAFTHQPGQLAKTIDNIIASLEPKKKKKIVPQKVAVKKASKPAPKPQAKPKEPEPKENPDKNLSNSFNRRSVRESTKNYNPELYLPQLPTFNHVPMKSPAKTYSRIPKTEGNGDSAEKVTKDKKKDTPKKETPKKTKKEKESPKKKKPKRSKNANSDTEEEGDGLNYFFDIPKIPSTIVPEEDSRDSQDSDGRLPDAISESPAGSSKASRETTPEKAPNVNPKKRILQEYSLEGSLSNPIELDSDSD